MSIPVIRTAIPKRRYQLGEFILTVLGDVESGDRIPYRYIFAIGREADARPGMYISLEETRGEDLQKGPFRLRLSMAEGEQVLGYGNQWRELDSFVEEATHVVKRVLNLDDEVPYRLM